MRKFLRKYVRLSLPVTLSFSAQPAAAWASSRVGNAGESIGGKRRAANDVVLRFFVSCDAMSTTNDDWAVALSNDWYNTFLARWSENNFTPKLHSWFFTLYESGLSAKLAVFGSADHMILWGWLQNLGLNKPGSN